MRKLGIVLAIFVLVGTACRGFQRQDKAANGYANALECVEVQGDTAARAVELCSRRSFAPGSPNYQEGWNSGLDCARGKGGSAADAAMACRSSA